MVLPPVTKAAGTYAAKKVAKRSLKERRLRKEVSRKAALANKRLKRLEKNELTDTPAYKQYIDSGKAKFGIKGKSYQEVQKESARLDKFIQSTTSTIRGANKVIKEIADNTGIKYKNLKELRQKASKFFELQSKVEQYLSTLDSIGSAFQYTEIWDSINEYVEKANVDLSDSSANIDDMVHDVTELLRQVEYPTHDMEIDDDDDDNWFKIK